MYIQLTPGFQNSSANTTVDEEVNVSPITHKNLIILSVFISIYNKHNTSYTCNEEELSEATRY